MLNFFEKCYFSFIIYVLPLCVCVWGGDGCMCVDVCMPHLGIHVYNNCMHTCSLILIYKNNFIWYNIFSLDLQNLISFFPVPIQTNVCCVNRVMAGISLKLEQKACRLLENTVKRKVQLLFSTSIFCPTNWAKIRSVERLTLDQRSCIFKTILTTF